MEMDWRRNSHRSFSPLLHPRTVSRSVLAPERHRGLTNRMKRTQHFVVATEIMRSLVFKVLGGLSLSR
jgi:hypothetical protein